MAKAIVGPTEQAYSYLEKFTTVSHSREIANSTRYWVTTHCSIEFEEEHGIWVYANGLRDLAKAFGCQIKYD